MAKPKKNRPSRVKADAVTAMPRHDAPLEPEDLIAESPESDPVHRAYGRTGHQDTSGVSGLPANDEDAGAERRNAYRKGAKLVSRID